MASGRLASKWLETSNATRGRPDRDVTSSYKGPTVLKRRHDKPLHRPQMQRRRKGKPFSVTKMTRLCTATIRMDTGRTRTQLTHLSCDSPQNSDCMVASYRRVSSCSSCRFVRWLRQRNPSPAHSCRSLIERDGEKEASCSQRVLDLALGFA
eukprot:1160118-Pelagomonas_calceolata.AAC.16